MAQMFSISDNESETETSEDREESGQMKNNRGSPQRKQHLPVPDKLKGESLSRACRIVTTHVISVVSWIHSTADHNYKQIQECSTLYIQRNSVVALVVAFKTNNESNLFHIKRYFKFILR